MRDYEIVYIFRSSLTSEEIEAKLERYHAIIAGDGSGEITAASHWGKRQLAYPIQKQKNAYYVVVQFTSDPAPLTGLERALKLDDDVLRYLIVIAERPLPAPEEPPDESAEAPADPPESAEPPEDEEASEAEAAEEEAPGAEESPEEAPEEEDSEAEAPGDEGSPEEAPEADASEEEDSEDEDSAEEAAAEEDAEAEDAEVEDAEAEDSAEEAAAEEDASPEAPAADADAETKED